jgi:glycosyltransferase involved in cell wall biosynthesis
MLVTVHDLSHKVCPHLQAEMNCRTLDEGLRFAMQRQARFLAVSHSTADDLKRLLQVPAARIDVVHEACNRRLFHAASPPQTRQAVRTRYGIPPGPFVLSLSTIEPRKNVLSIVRACRELFHTNPDLKFTLVLAGAVGWGEQGDLWREVRDVDGIQQIGSVSDADLAALYQEASATCCVSFYEGFCLPALEAMSCGCPVIYSDRSALPEIVGDAGLPSAPTDVLELAAHIRRLLTDARFRAQLRERGLERAAAFSWERAARETLSLYETCAADAEGSRTESRTTRSNNRPESLRREADRRRPSQVGR